MCCRSADDLVGTHSCLHSLPSDFPPLDEDVLKTYENRIGKNIEHKKGSQVCCDHLSSCVGKMKNHKLKKVVWRTLEQGATDRGRIRRRSAMAEKRKRQADELKEEEDRIRERLKEDEQQAERDFDVRRQQLEKRKETVLAKAKALGLPRKFLPEIKIKRLHEHEQLVVDLHSDDLHAFVNFPSQVCLDAFLSAVLPFVPKHRKAGTDELTRLKVTLFAVASGLSSRTLDRMGWVSRTTISTWVNEITEAIVKAPLYKQYVRFLTDEEWEKEMERYESYKDRYVLIFTDGSVLETVECTDPALARAMRSGKHNIPAFVFFVVVSPRGRVVYVSDYVAGGSVHDSVHWQVSDVVKRLKEEYPTAFTANGKRRAVSGDKAYPCIDVPHEWQLIITKTGETDKPEFGVDDHQTEEIAAMIKVLQERYALRDDTGSDMPGVSFDPEMAVPRSVVERTIRRIKSWRILESTWTTDQHVTQRLLLFCVFGTKTSLLIMQIFLFSTSLSSLSSLS